MNEEPPISVIFDKNINHYRSKGENHPYITGWILETAPSLEHLKKSRVVVIPTPGNQEDLSVLQGKFVAFWSQIRDVFRFDDDVLRYYHLCGIWSPRELADNESQELKDKLLKELEAKQHQCGNGTVEARVEEEKIEIYVAEVLSSDFFERETDKFIKDIQYLENCLENAQIEGNTEAISEIQDKIDELIFPGIKDKIIETTIDHIQTGNEPGNVNLDHAEDLYDIPDPRLLED